MVSFAINAPEKLSRVFSEWVMYEGARSGATTHTATALKEGQAVCYNADYGTATTADGRRFNRVELPNTVHAQFFAGVSAREIPAGSTPQLIEIYNPGSVCNIYVAVSTILNRGLLTFDVTSGVAGQFIREGMPGAGSATPQQTTTYVATAQLCLALLQVGLPSGGIELVELAGGSAFVAMVGGTTQCTGYSAATDATETIVDGLIPSLRKKIVVKGTAIDGGGAIVLTIENSDGIMLDGTALATLTYTNAAIGAGSTIEWKDGAWHHIQGAGWAEA